MSNTDQPCPECGGSGYDTKPKSNYVVCRGCGGTGRLPKADQPNVNKTPSSVDIASTDVNNFADQSTPDDLMDKLIFIITGTNDMPAEVKLLPEYAEAKAQLQQYGQQKYFEGYKAGAEFTANVYDKAIGESIDELRTRANIGPQGGLDGVKGEK